MSGGQMDGSTTIVWLLELENHKPFAAIECGKSENLLLLFNVHLSSEMAEAPMMMFYRDIDTDWHLMMAVKYSSSPVLRRCTILFLVIGINSQ